MPSARIEPRPVRVLVQAISTSNLTLSGLQTVDGVALPANSLCGALGQSDNKSAVYMVQSGPWIPVNPGMGTGLEVYALAGSSNGLAVYGCDTEGAIVWGTTSTTFTLKSGGGAMFNPAAPGAIGGGTPAAITGTTITATSHFSGSGSGLTGIPASAIASALNSPTEIGGGTPSTVTATTFTPTLVGTTGATGRVLLGVGAYNGATSGIWQGLNINDGSNDNVTIVSLATSGTGQVVIYEGAISIANNATFDIDTNGKGGSFQAVDVNSAEPFFCGFATSCVPNLGGIAYDGWSTTEGTASCINVYAASSKLRLENKTGTTRLLLITIKLALSA